MRALVLLGCLAGCATRGASAVQPAAVEPGVSAPARPLANFGVLARHVADGGAWYSFGEGERLARLDPATAESLGVTKSVVVAQPLEGLVPWRWIGGVLLLRDPRMLDVVAVDPRTLVRRWQIDTANQHVTVTDRMLFDASFGAGEVLVARSLATGQEVWRRRGTDDLYFDLYHQTEGDRVFVSENGELHALDGDTGAPRWPRAVAVGRTCGWVVEDGVLIVESEEGYHVIDAATGATLRTIASAGACSWKPVSAPGFVDGVVGGGALVVAEPREGPRTVLRSFDLASGAERWRRPPGGLRLMRAERDMVVAMRGEGVLVVLDAATGAERAAVSLGIRPDDDWFDLWTTTGGGASGPLVVVTFADASVWVLGRGKPT